MGQGLPLAIVAPALHALPGAATQLPEQALVDKPVTFPKVDDGQAAHSVAPLAAAP